MTKKTKNATTKPSTKESKLKKEKTLVSKPSKNHHKKEKRTPRTIISIILLVFFIPFALWSLATKQLTVFFIVAAIVYFTQVIMRKTWPRENELHKRNK